MRQVEGANWERNITGDLIAGAPKTLVLKDAGRACYNKNKAQKHCK
jgi:hypothetical protein